MSTQPQNPLFNRKASLIVAHDLQGLDLSELRFTFKISAADLETPNIAEIRVYNLSEKTAKQVINEFDSVILQAGYESNFAVIFKGTIKQFRKGKERNTDTYLDILAADGDVFYNFGYVNGGKGLNLAAGATPQDQLNKLAKDASVAIDPNADAGITGGALPRGKVLFGLWRNYARDIAVSNDLRWSVQNGVLIFVPLTGYLPSKEAVKINSATGMIGIPEATDNGIAVRVLLNPLIKIGTAVQLNNKDINQTIVREQFFPTYQSITLVADVTLDGFYRVLVIEHSGDTRGQEWYSDIICLSLDPSAKKTNAVKAFG